MAKAKIIFDLQDSEDLFQYKVTNKATEMYCVLFEIKNNFKSKFKNMEDLNWDTAFIIFEALDEITKEIDLENC